MQESNRVEFKRTLNDKLEKEVVAFLNNREGGVLYIGVDDDGHPVGLDDLDAMQLKITDRIKNNILPMTLGLFDIVVEEIDGIKVLKIIIAGGLEKPYYIKNQGMSPTGCYIRVGASAQPMTTAMIDGLYTKRLHTSLRNILAPRQDLTFEQLKIYYQEHGSKMSPERGSQARHVLKRTWRILLLCVKRSSMLLYIMTTCGRYHQCLRSFRIGSVSRPSGA